MIINSTILCIPFEPKKKTIFTEKCGGGHHVDRMGTLFILFSGEKKISFGRRNFLHHAQLSRKGGGV